MAETFQQMPDQCEVEIGLQWNGQATSKLLV
jgi:hypothetical protein